LGRYDGCQVGEGYEIKKIGGMMMDGCLFAEKGEDDG
jgi:hypothetical protein